MKPLSVPVILVKLTEDDQIRKDVPYFDEMIVLGTDKPIYLFKLIFLNVTILSSLYPKATTLHG